MENETIKPDQIKILDTLFEKTASGEFKSKIGTDEDYKTLGEIFDEDE